MAFLYDEPGPYDASSDSYNGGAPAGSGGAGDIWGGSGYAPVPVKPKEKPPVKLRSKARRRDVVAAVLALWR